MDYECYMLRNCCQNFLPILREFEQISQGSQAIQCCPLLPEMLLIIDYAASNLTIWALKGPSKYKVQGAQGANHLKNVQYLA